MSTGQIVVQSNFDMSLFGGFTAFASMASQSSDMFSRLQRHFAHCRSRDGNAIPAAEV
jgi:hypothetical protein